MPVQHSEPCQSLQELQQAHAVLTERVNTIESRQNVIEGRQDKATDGIQRVETMLNETRIESATKMGAIAQSITGLEVRMLTAIQQQAKPTTKLNLTPYIIAAITLTASLATTLLNTLIQHAIK